jgi:hypothetical protein
VCSAERGLSATPVSTVVPGLPNTGEATPSNDFHWIAVLAAFPVLFATIYVIRKKI